MSLHMRPESTVPEDTARVARAAFPKGNPSLALRDELATMYADTRFADLFPKRGQPAEAPGRLAVVCVLQFAEGLSDRQAAEAVRSRIDWKYLLGLALENPGVDCSVLSEFRDRLLAGAQEQRLLDDLLERFRARGLVKERGTQRTDSTHIQAAVRNLNRLEYVGETLRYALNSVVRIAPEWLQARAPTAWYKRYGARFEQYRLPQTESEREQLTLHIGQDGHQLLSWVYSPDSPAQLQHAQRWTSCGRYGCSSTTLSKTNSSGVSLITCLPLSASSTRLTTLKRATVRSARPSGLGTKPI